MRQEYTLLINGDLPNDIRLEPSKSIVVFLFFDAFILCVMQLPLSSPIKNLFCPRSLNSVMYAMKERKS